MAVLLAMSGDGEAVKTGREEKTVAGEPGKSSDTDANPLCPPFLRAAAYKATYQNR